MSKTAEAVAQIESEYARVIAELVSDAVAPPLAEFQTAALKTIEDSAKQVLARGDATLARSDRSSRDVQERIDALATQTEKAADELTGAVRSLTQRVEKTVAETIAAPIAQLRDRQLVPLDKHVETARREANAGIDRLAASVEKVASAVDASRQETAKGIRDAGAALHKQADANAKAVTHGFTKVAEAFGATRDDIKGAQSRVEQARTALANDIAALRALVEGQLEDQTTQATTRHEATTVTVLHVSKQVIALADQLEKRVKAAETLMLHELMAIRRNQLRAAAGWGVALVLILIALLNVA